MEELQKLYDVLVREGKYSKSFQEFQSKWSKDKAYKDKVYGVVTRDGLYGKDKDSFFEKYSTPETIVKKKVSLESSVPQIPKTDTTELPVEDGSLVTQPTKLDLTSQEPTDMSGKPLLPKQKEFKEAFGKIQKEDKIAKEEKKKYEKQYLGSDFIRLDSQYFKDRLSSINADLINREEEYVVPQLQYQFGDLGFNFEESGATGDYVKVTAPNGQTTEISLDNLFESKSKTQSDSLQKFIKENTATKRLFVLEKTMKEQDRKFNSEKQVDDSIKVISNEVNALNAKQKQFLIKKAQFEKNMSDLGATPELEQQRLVLNEEMKSILQEEETIKQKGSRLSSAVGKYSISKSKQGTWGGAIWNAVNEGFSSISAGTTSLITDIATEIAPSGFGMSPKDLKNVSTDIAKKIGVKGPSSEQTVEQWKETLTEDQLDKWEDEVDDYTKKDIKSKTLPFIRIGNREILGDADTTKQFSDLKEEGFWGGAILGLAKSLPAMIGSAGPAGWAQRTAQMYAQISDGLAVEMENNPEFANITENEKLAITLPIGITSAVLEAYGLRNVMASKGVINSLTMSVLGKAGVGTSARTFRELVENEVESKLARGLLTITAAGLAEFETGAAQELTETGFKAIYNEIKGKGMFETPESITDLIKNVAVAGAQEAVGGFVLGVPSGVSAAYSKKGFLKMDDASFETFANMANDEKMQSSYIANLKEKITQGLITEKEAKEQLNDYRNSAGLYRQLPEGLSTQQQKEAMNLLKEKRDLQNFVDGKDVALVVKQKNRITEINNELTKLSETDAVQEQTTDESVLRTGQPEVGLQGVGEGNAKTEGVTQEETITTTQPENKIESVRSNFENGNLQNIEITPTRQGFDGDFLNDYEFLAEGSEHTVYRSKDGKTVVKIGEPYGSNEGFMPRVEDALTISNLIGDGSLEVIGYYESNGVKNPIYQQNYIDGKTMTQEAVASHLESKGFVNLGNDKFGINVNGKSYEISDTSDNFIIDNQGNVSAIDAGIMELDENKLTEEQRSKLLAPKTEVTPSETIITEQEGLPPVPEGFDIATEAFPIQAQESRVKSAQSLLDEAKTKAAKKKAMTDLVREQGKLAEMKAFEKVTPTEVKAEAAEVKIVGTNPITSIDIVDDYNAMTEQYRNKNKALTLSFRDNKMTNKEVNALKIQLKNNLKEATKISQESKAKPTEVKAEVAPSEVDALLDLDTKDKTKLKRVLKYLDSLDDTLNLNPNELNDVTRVMAIATAKLVVKALKVLVNTGITLQEAIKQVAADNNLKVSDVTKGIKALSEIAKIPTGYNDLMAKADKLIARQKSKGVTQKKIVSNLDKMVRKSDVYLDANDAQKKIMEREARAKMGVAPKKAVSIGRVIGALKDIQNISREEKLKIIGRIRELSRDAAKDLVEEIRELAKGGKITPTQSINIIAKFGKVNMLNEISVSNFVDYMAKVFADADYDNKISVAKKKLKNAKKNINTKIGIANGLASPLQALFSINPSLIPIKNLERYIELVDMFSERKAVLQLDEISQVIKDVNEILDEIDNELSVADELSFRLNYSDNKIIEDGKLDYAATIKNMVKKGDITQEEAEIMSKYKSEIIPQVEIDKKTDEEIAEEKAELEKELKELSVNSSDLPTRDERIVAKRIAQYLSAPFIKQLSNAELKNLIKAIDNINNGYLPHQAELILEKLDGLSDGKTIANSIKKANLKTISQAVNTLYNTIKSKITGKETVFEMISRTPLFNIDQILGDFKTEELYYALLGKVAKGDAKNSFDLKTIQDKLQKAQDRVLKSFSSNPLTLKESNYKIRAYQLQLENDSNPGDKRVNPAAEYIKETIKHIKKLESQYNENDVKILEKILKDFAPDGQIDIDKLYNSFNSAEKSSIEVMQEIKKSETEMAEFTGAVIRGKRIVPLNNHTHISVLGDNSKEDLDVGVSFANEYNDSLKPSTKAKNLMERTPGAKAINFDPYSTALKSVKYVLLDYNLTTPVRTARKAIKEAEVELEKNGKMSQEQRRIFISVRAAFELAVTDLVNNSYVQTSTTQDIVNFISKQGYRSVLAGLGKSAVELMSNLGFVVFDPFTFYKGAEQMGILLSEDGPAIMNNSKSIQTNRVYASGMSGRMLDLGILDQSVGTKSSKTRGKIINKAQQIWNLTVKKFIKNPVELAADALISSPDKVIMRPYWLGSYITELEKQLDRKVTKEDLKKIAENDEVFMNENQVAIENATKVADKKSKLMGATKNNFAGLLKGRTRVGDNTVSVITKNFNSFMTNFMVYEFNAAKTGIMAAVGQGTMTKKEGAAVLAGVITRMTVYNLLIKSVSAGVSGLIGSALGFEDDEEEKEKTVDQLVTQSLASTFATLMLGRDFGNISKTAINYGFEEYVTKEYLEGLRTGEYDPYKDNILFNSLKVDEKTGEMETWENIPNFMGSYGPTAKTLAFGIKSLSADEKKTYEAKERQEKERTIRLPLEIMGNLGYIPLYKEIRKSVMDDIYKGLKDGGGISREELKKSDPKMYKIMYGED